MPLTADPCEQFFLPRIVRLNPFQFSFRFRGVPASNKLRRNAPMEQRKCAEIVDGKKCGFELVDQGPLKELSRNCISTFAHWAIELTCFLPLKRLQPIPNEAGSVSSARSVLISFLVELFSYVKAID